MDRVYLTQMTFFISVHCAAAAELLQSPSQPRCVFIAYDKVTCHWTPGDNSPASTVYTLEANVTRFDCDSFGKHAFSCSRINQTQCSGPMSSPDRLYSVRVTAHSAADTASSPTLCVNALEAVKLRRPVLSDLRPAEDESRCLELRWQKPVKFALTRQNICTGSVNYQLQYSSEDQLEAQTVEGYLGEHLERLQCEASLKKNQTVRLRTPCSLRPFTQYTIQLRLRYLSIWSEWSNQLQSCTGMAVPITPPQLWRILKPSDDLQRRQVTLLWKLPPRSQTVCTSLWFNARCQSEISHSALQTESCWNITNTSCQLTLPMERASCSLTVCNSAGCSPAAQLTLPAPTDTPLRAIKTVGVRALNDSSLEFTWSALTRTSLTSFLLEWEPVTNGGRDNLHWARLSHNTSSIIITDMLPEVRYIVTVQPEFGSENGEAVSAEAYTKQGVPSAGPRLQVKEQSGSAILVVWEPPPVGEQHGFITQYSLYCQRENNSTSEVHTVSGETRSYRLAGLSGVYHIYMTAHTVAGEGRASPPNWVTVGEGYSGATILVCILVPVSIVVLLLIITACRQRIRQIVWPGVPDPALSSLTAWMANSQRTTTNFYSVGEAHSSTSELTNGLNYEEDC